MKIRDIVQERINWNALRQAKAVMPYLYDSPEARKAGEKPNPNEPNIITSVNLKQAPRPGDRLTPLPQMSPAAWQRYMDAWWQNSKTDPDAKEKVAQIKQAAADAKMPITEFIIMPHTADTMGLIHRPGTGPNNRYDFKNKGNNRANEKAPPGREEQVKALKGKVDNPYAVAWASYNKSKKEDAAGVGIVTKQNATKDVPVGGQYMNVKKLGLGKGKPKTMKEEFAEFLENIDPKVWTELRAKGLVRPMHFDSPEVRAAYKEKGLPYKPDISIITKDNLDQFRTKEPERLKQLKPIQVSDQQWINYMDKWWRTERLKPKAKDKVQQIKNAYKLLYKKDMVENFADGKKKGKSRPGRVKKSGASCNGSVTALRKRAKNSSGEKAKMYHWCANMKSGRKKK